MFKRIAPGTILIVLFASGCGSQLPGIQDGKQVLEGWVNKDQCVEISNFAKTDGRLDDDGKYEMLFTATATLNKPCYAWYPEGGKSFQVFPTQKKVNWLQRKYESGHVFHVQGTVVFTKMESGWKGNGVRF